jgi:D-serine deaminase-like pyridoxal phosphate-dependent protein
VIGRPKEALETPALLVDLPALERNSARMAQTIVQEASRLSHRVSGVQSLALRALGRRVRRPAQMEP